MRRGFTLVELNIAVLFVALLVLAVAITVMNSTRLYEKGLALKTVNQTGREVMDVLQRDITTARADRIKYFAPVGGVGRLCLGTASYIFNTADALNGTGTLVRDTSIASSPPIRLARVDDRDSLWCDRSGGVFTKTQLSTGDTYTELLQKDSETISLAVHSMDIALIAGNTADRVSQGLVKVMLQIGTNEVNTTSGGACKPPSDHESHFDGCAVREFNTVVHNKGTTE
ncbi:hypothetical protein CR983_00530 [Candidatus Saccharibacteria bacterium]|nr:MAG: hypothetical protein CR983_00530 [Candidatus Saccharibacteria bacterium]